MRAAAIFGLGSSQRDLKPFQENSSAHWIIGVPAQSSDADVILVFGGDGTVHRHLRQLVNLQRPVLVVPAGSGNDFARALNLRSVKDSLAAWKQFSSRSPGNVRAIDLGVITPLLATPHDAENGGEEPTPPDPSPYSLPGTRHYFSCVAGCGLDSDIARRANHLPRWLRAHGGYALSLPPALLRFSPPQMRLSVPRLPADSEFDLRSDKPTTLVAFANASSYGDGMRIAPKAELDDGKLDVCVIDALNKTRLLRLFPTVYFGRHLKVPEVEYFQSDRLRLETESPLDVYADGEYVCQTPVEVGVASSILKVVVP
jgi:diacylglycerol kinase (ATP)